MFARCIYGAEKWLAIAAVVGIRAHRHLTHDHAALRYLTSRDSRCIILHQTVSSVVVGMPPARASHLSQAIDEFMLVLVTAATCFLSLRGVIRACAAAALVRSGSRAWRASQDTTAHPCVPVGATETRTELGVPQDINDLGSQLVMARIPSQAGRRLTGSKGVFYSILAVLFGLSEGINHAVGLAARTGRHSSRKRWSGNQRVVVIFALIPSSGASKRHFDG